MPLGGLVTAGIIAAGAGALAGGIKGVSDINRAKKIKVPEYKPFEVSKSAQRMQGLAQAQMFAAAPGQRALERSLLASQAGGMAATQRAAGSGAQALAAAAGLQAGTNQALAQQAMQEQAMQQQRLANLFGAEQNMQQQELAKFQYDEEFRRMEQQRQQQMRDAGWQSIVGGLQNLGGTMIAAGGLPTGGRPAANRADMFERARYTTGPVTSQTPSLMSSFGPSPQSMYNMGSMAQLPSSMRPQAPGMPIGVGFNALPNIMSAIQRPDVNQFPRRR